MNLKLFFSLPYQENTESLKSYPMLGVKFDKRFIFQNEYLKASVRIVNYNSEHTYVNLTYKYYNSDICQLRYFADHAIHDDKILITKISQAVINV